MSNTSKSHKTRKTGSTKPRQAAVKPRSKPMESAPASGPSSTALALTTPPVPQPAVPNPLEGILTRQESGGDADVDVSTGVPTEDPKRQWWYREPTSKTRKQAEKVMVMRAAGHADAAIAKKLSTTEGNVRQTIYVARKNGWLDADDEPIDLEVELALNIDRKVVRNISASLDGGMTNWQTHEMTIAAAKGRGVFKNHEVSKNDGPMALPIVAIQIVMPPVGEGDQLPGVREDQMGGTPAYVEGVVGD